MARLVNEVEKSMASPESYYHHKHEKGYQVTFQKDVKSLVQVLEGYISELLLTEFNDCSLGVCA